jgi:hypothetical protein
MTCHECRDVMLEVARDRAASLIERAVLDHTAGCSACRRDLERERALTAGLRAVAVHHSGRAPSPDLEARLLEAFASQARDAEGERAPNSPAFAARVRGWLPLAAGLALCTAAALAWWLTRPESVARPPAVATAVRQPEPMAPVQQASAADPPQTIRDPAPARHHGRRAAKRAPIQATGFIPIPSAVGLPDFESGQIVRLGIPITALPTYGVEIPSGGESSIQADLLVGQDGQPRAIRLVSSTSSDSQPRR